MLGIVHTDCPETSRDGTDDTGSGSMNGESDEEETAVEPDEAEPQVEIDSSSRLRNGITLGEQIL